VRIKIQIDNTLHKFGELLKGTAGGAEVRITISSGNSVLSGTGQVFPIDVTAEDVFKCEDGAMSFGGKGLFERLALCTYYNKKKEFRVSYKMLKNPRRILSESKFQPNLTESRFTFSNPTILSLAINPRLTRDFLGLNK
jgi:hypothetical protein